jgi:DICT domain-containing protein
MLEGSLLHQLKTLHRPGQVGKRSLNFGVYYKNTLVSLCHALEDCILTCNSQPLVITAFQRGQWYLQEADRYQALAGHSQQVVIMATPDAGFAEHPTSQAPNVQLVSLADGDPVAQEWHLIILAPTYSAMVLCQELSAQDYGKQGQPSQDLERKFYGFWTFEANLVQEAMELAIAHINTYNPSLANYLSAQIQAIHAAQSTEMQDDLTAIVARVVHSLQINHDHLTGLEQTTHSSAQLNNLDKNLLSNELQAFLRMAQLLDQADALNPTAAAEVATLAETMGQILDLPAWQLNRLRLAGLLHRLAPLQKTESALTPGTFGRYSEETTDVSPSCPLVPGAQVLRTMPQLRAIATIITHHTEHWDGSGQPAGLAGDEIPLESRILGLVEYFQQQFAHLRTHSAAPEMSLEACMTKALSECQNDQHRRWDPKLVDTLTLLVCSLQQGLTLTVNLPKISAGLWLIDGHCGDKLFEGE